MTYLLSAPTPDQPQIQARGSDAGGLPTYWQGIGAATTASQIEADASNMFDNRVLLVKSTRSVDIAERVGLDSFIAHYNANEAGFDHINKPPTTIEEAARDYEPFFTEWAYSAARADAEVNGAAWEGIDLTDQSAEDEALRQIQKEYQDAQDILAMTSPDSQISTTLIGGAGASILDTRNIPWLLAGGGEGSFLRIVGREAMLNMAAEGVQMPSRFEMAERLQIPDPNVAQELAIAGVAGGFLGGFVDAGQRGLRYVWDINRKVAGSQRSAAEQIILTDAAEDALLNSENPFADIIQMMDDNPIEPRILAPSERVRVEDGPRPWEQEGDPGPQVFDGPDEIEAQIQSEIDEIRSTQLRIRKPVTDFVARGGHDAGSTAGRGIHPDGEFAQELRNRGITTRTQPGLFSRKGSKDFDNVTASEAEGELPGLSYIAGVDGDYLNRNGLLDIVADELNGKPAQLHARVRLDELENMLAEHQRLKASRSEFINPIPDDLADDALVSAMSGIKDAVDQGISMRGLDGMVSRRMRDDMVEQIATRGGTVDDLLDDMDDADLKFAESTIGPDDGRPFAEYGPEDFARNDAAGASELEARTGGAGRPEQGAGATQGRAGGDRTSDGPRTERTAAGEQSLIDGVAPVTQRERLEAAQRAKLMGGAQAADEGLFDLGARAQMDFLDDTSSPQAKAVQAQRSADVRDAIADGFDPQITLEDGRTMTVSQMMDDLDLGDRFTARIDLCGKGPS